MISKNEKSYQRVVKKQRSFKETFKNNHMYDPETKYFVGTVPHREFNYHPTIPISLISSTKPHSYLMYLYRLPYLPYPIAIICTLYS